MPAQAGQSPRPPRISLPRARNRHYPGCRGRTTRTPDESDPKGHGARGRVPQRLVLGDGSLPADGLQSPGPTLGFHAPRRLGCVPGRAPRRPGRGPPGAHGVGRRPGGGGEGRVRIPSRILAALASAGSGTDWAGHRSRRPGRALCRGPRRAARGGLLRSSVTGGLACRRQMKATRWRVV